MALIGKKQDNGNDTPVEMVPVSDLVIHPDNPRQGDVGAIVTSIENNGWDGTIVAQRSTRRVLAGNHRLQAAHGAGIEQVPVYWVDVDDTEAKRILLADNRTSDLASWDDNILAGLLESLAQQDELLGSGYDGDDVDELLADLNYDFGEDSVFDNAQIPADDSLRHNVDVFVNIGIQLLKIAVTTGIGAGQISSSCSQLFFDKAKLLNVKIDFIDNEFTDYNHEKHLQAVELFQPKYATVRDLMTKKQCQEAGTEYYTFEQIMEWAEQVSEHAQNVIIIPKYDCIDKIPDKYMLGYSVPSSYGGTPLPLEAFKGRNVHLLGGNWKRQLTALSVLGEDIVSLDNNHMMKISRFGLMYGPNGTEVDASTHLQEYGGYFGYVVPFVLSIMRMVTDLNRMGCSVNDRRMSRANDEPTIDFSDVGGWEEYTPTERDGNE